jgi:hypothetical protein
MHFTVTFTSPTSGDVDLSYGLVFTPCPVWVHGEKEILNLNPERPDYRQGSVSRLVRAVKISDRLGDKAMATVLVHPEGYGSVKDFFTLIQDLMEARMEVSVAGTLSRTGPVA